MLQTQVDYWKNVEQKRHNLEQEAIDWAGVNIRSKEADIAKYRADTDRATMETGAINALTAQTEAQIKRDTLSLSRDQYELEKIKTAQNLAIAEMQNQAAKMQANAALQQAAAQTKRTDYDVQLTDAKTKYQEAENEWQFAKNLADVAATGTRALDNLGISLNNITGGVRSLFSNVRYHLHN